MADPSERLKDAEDDIASMRMLLQGRHPKHARFHAQQSVEKAFKAILLARQQTVPRTHDLVDLLSRVRTAMPAFPDHLRAATTLGRYYGLLRYPDSRPPSWVPPSQAEAEETARWAEAIVADVGVRPP
ncbi:MAG: HEPN domain-containing protein [Planctomycetes bacterium]|nr:HEPN domain-containing protein [Planctomycetota bacterium]